MSGFFLKWVDAYALYLDYLYGIVTSYSRVELTREQFYRIAFKHSSHLII